MRAIVIREIGDVDKLELAELPRPSLLAGQVLVKVRAIGVCYRDLLDRQGKYPFMKRPVVTGHEFAGEVAEAPAGSGFSVGDRVVGMHRPPCGACDECRAGEETRCIQSVYSFGHTVDGCYAEYVAAHGPALVPMPPGVEFTDAAFLHCTAGVALRALRSRAQLQAGETVLITGASGGVGIHAVQLARILGAKVVAVTSKAAKAQALADAGADEVIVSSGDFQREALARTGGGAHVSLELLGAPTFNASLRSLRSGGRMVIVGNVTASRVEVNPGWVILKQVSVLGSAGASRRDVVDVLDWVARKRLKPVVAATMPLEEARAAQMRLLAQNVVGRIVLVP
jgi:D-arabinose 1-dehydrogenase-like Zn-dependent alcohol dehydrogenase